MSSYLPTTCSKNLNKTSIVNVLYHQTISGLNLSNRCIYTDTTVCVEGKHQAFRKYSPVDNSLFCVDPKIIPNPPGCCPDICTIIVISVKSDVPMETGWYLERVSQLPHPHLCVLASRPSMRQTPTSCPPPGPSSTEANGPRRLNRQPPHAGHHGNRLVACDSPLSQGNSSF